MGCLETSPPGDQGLSAFSLLICALPHDQLGQASAVSQNEWPHNSANSSRHQCLLLLIIGDLPEEMPHITDKPCRQDSGNSAVILPPMPAAAPHQHADPQKCSMISAVPRGLHTMRQRLLAHVTISASRPSSMARLISIPILLPTPNVCPYWYFVYGLVVATIGLPGTRSETS